MMVLWKKNLVFLWIAQFFSIAGFSFALPFTPFYLQELGIEDPTQLRVWSGLVSAAAGFSMAIMTPFWGYLADRFGKKPMALRATLGGTIALCGIGLSQSPGMMLGFRIIQGAFTGTVMAILTLAVAETPKERVGLTIGLMNAAVFVGNSVAPLAGGVFSDMFGYRASFFVAAGFLFVSFTLALFFVQENFVSQPNKAFSFFADSKSLLMFGGVLPIVGLFWLYGISRTLQMPVLPLFIRELMGTDLRVATQTGIVTSAAGIASVLSGILFGSLADKGNILHIGRLCAFSASLLGGSILLIHKVWHLVALYFLAAFFIGGIDAILKILLTRIVPASQQGSAFGLLGSSRAFGWSMGSLSGGVLAAFLGFRAVFVLTAGFFLLIALILHLLSRSKVLAIKN